jgi:tetratricopeptide (TPR) repeat protein
MTRFSLIGSLLFVCTAVLSLSCSDNPAVRQRYQAEKQFVQAEKSLRDYQARPQPRDAAELRAIAADYRHLVDFCINALSSLDDVRYGTESRELKLLTFQSATRLSQLYYSTRQYDSSIAVLHRLLAGVKLENAATVATRLNLGRAMQSAGTWDSAQAVYDDLIAAYYPPVDDSGQIVLELFNLPLQIYRVAGYIQDSASALIAFDRAERYYLRLSREYAGKNLEVNSRANLASLYSEAGRWDKAIAELTELNRLAGTGNIAAELKIADIYAIRLGKPDTALALYDRILQRLRSADSLNYPLVLFKTAIVKMDKKRYAEARSIVVRLKDDFPRFFAGTPLAQLTLARSFEEEGNWSRAEAEYSLLIEKYPGSDEAMGAHLHIADYYEKQGRKEEAQRWFKLSEEYFDRMSVRGSGSPLEAKALIFKADLFRRRGDLRKVADVLLDLFNKYPQSEPGRRAIAQASLIYRRELGDAARADSLLQVLKASLSEVDQRNEI